jgi:hypothetical protein
LSKENQQSILSFRAFPPTTTQPRSSSGSTVDREVVPVGPSHVLADEPVSCALCHRRCDEPAAGFKVHFFCAPCLAALGRFATASTSRTQVWHAMGLPSVQLKPVDPSRLAAACEWLAQRVDDELRARGLPASGKCLVEQASDDLKKGLTSLEAADTHLDLAIAYREMSLAGDALIEAADSLSLAQLPRERADVALGMLLDESALEIGVDEALDLIREAVFLH